MTQQAAQVAAVAAVACGCLLLGFLLGFLLGRRPLSRARAAAARLQADVDRLGALVQEHAGRAQVAAEEARIQYVRSQADEALRRQAELRAYVAEVETEELRTAIKQWESTPCVLCGKRLPHCPHGAQEREAELRERGAFRPLRQRVGGPPLPHDLPPWRAEADGWRETAKLGEALLAPRDPDDPPAR